MCYVFLDDESFPFLPYWKDSIIIMVVQSRNGGLGSKQWKLKDCIAVHKLLGTVLPEPDAASSKCSAENQLHNSENNQFPFLSLATMRTMYLIVYKFVKLGSDFKLVDCWQGRVLKGNDSKLSKRGDGGVDHEGLPWGISIILLSETNYKENCYSFKEKDQIQVTLNTCTWFIYCRAIAPERGQSWFSADFFLGAWGFVCALSRQGCFSSNYDSLLCGGQYLILLTFIVRPVTTEAVIDLKKTTKSIYPSTNACIRC